MIGKVEAKQELHSHRESLCEASVATQSHGDKLWQLVDVEQKLGHSSIYPDHISSFSSLNPASGLYASPLPSAPALL